VITLLCDGPLCGYRVRDLENIPVSPLSWSGHTEKKSCLSGEIALFFNSSILFKSILLANSFCKKTYFFKYYDIKAYKYSVHLPNDDTLSIAFENTVFSLIPKENATILVSSVLK
jgi:hypothetical protein